MELHNRGFKTNHETVLKLMKNLGLQCFGCQTFGFSKKNISFFQVINHFLKKTHRIYENKHNLFMFNSLCF